MQQLPKDETHVLTLGFCKQAHPSSWGGAYYSFSYSRKYFHVGRIYPEIQRHHCGWASWSPLCCSCPRYNGVAPLLHDRVGWGGSWTPYALHSLGSYYWSYNSSSISFGKASKCFYGWGLSMCLSQKWEAQKDLPLVQTHSEWFSLRPEKYELVGQRF